jgi:hypothetical protein
MMGIAHAREDSMIEKNNDLGQSAIIVGKLGEPGTILYRLPTERPSQ